ncbi:MAG: hypothetical protein ABIX46_05660 [Burkholderiaceae bacterium]
MTLNSVHASFKAVAFLVLGLMLASVLWGLYISVTHWAGIGV